MKIVKTYNSDYFGKLQRKKTEEKLFSDGYKIELEEEVKEWDSGRACCLLILFFPLVFFARMQRIKVTYSKD